jgi:isocitrate dehydrogenase
MLMSGIMMLRHLGEFEAANKIEQALYVTMDIDGVQMRDTMPEKAASTSGFADAIIANLGKSHPTFVKRDYKPVHLPVVSKAADFVKVEKRQISGLDVFLEAAVSPAIIGATLDTAVEGTPVKLKMLSSRGVKLYPGTNLVSDGVDMITARLAVRESGYSLTDADIADVIQKIGAHYKWNHIEKLNVFDGVLGFTKAHGED